MRKLLLIFCGLFFLGHTLPASAQCTGCTQTISGIETLPYFVMAGTDLCITSTGDLQGDLVINGGNVCVEGTISSFNIQILSGSLLILSSGQVITNDFGMVEGQVTNNGLINAPQFGILGSNIDFTNLGTMTTTSFGVAFAGTGTPTNFTNQGTITCDNAAIDGSYFNNYGEMNVNVDYANNLGSTTWNTGQFTVGRDFGNVADVYTGCVISVGRDFANDGDITGPFGVCGGFSVVGITANTGNYGADGSSVDMCDAGGPPGGFDANTGTLGAGVTFCACPNPCSPVGINDLEEQVVFSVYPNPMMIESTITFDAVINTGVVSIYSIDGKQIKQIPFVNTNQIGINREGLSPGLYLLNVAFADGSVGTQQLVVE